MNNLLLQLHRWISRQDENFTTEALAHVLKHLREHEPVVATRLFTRLTKGVVSFSPEQAESTKITTQATTVVGNRPDIEIRTVCSLVYVEAKVESDLGHQQLERYRNELDKALAEKNGVLNTGLVLLTRYPISMAGLGGRPDAAIRWHHIGEWLWIERRNKTINHPTSEYLVDQFLGYLKARSMIMEPVSWELVRGARGFRDLMLMLQESAAALNLSIVQAYGFDYFGFNLDGKRYFLGVQYVSAEKVIFYTKKVRVDPQGDKKLGFGFVRPSKFGGGLVWQWNLDLTTEDIHFFARSLSSQKECLEQFLARCIQAVKQIEIKDPQGVPVETPDESEEQILDEDRIPENS